MRPEMTPSDVPVIRCPLWCENSAMAGPYRMSEAPT